MTPYFRDNTLYFSSDGWPSIGGLDIFSAEWDGTNWSEPKNMGAGYNSGYDDWYFSASQDGTRGFLVSNRPADGARSVKSKTCCDEIYTFEIRDIVIDLLATVFDNETKEPLLAAQVTKFEVVNNRPGKSETKSNEVSNDFNFLLDSDKSYKVTVEREGYFPKDFTFNTVGMYEAQTFKAPVYLDKAPDAEPDTRTITINEPIRLNNIYYDFDDDKILLDAEQDLEVILDLMDDYPEMVIEMSSHTDAQGNDNYNQRLSQRRAQSAVDWLIENGIDPQRLRAVGYGETQILNRCKNGVKCTDDEHRFNRRTEFKIIEGPTSIEIKKEVLDEKKN
jgi:peptidoglycan-associated lipoprotein